MYTKIDSIICSYLNTPDTDYALFLNGEWGSGKTYYTKNHLIELDVSKKYQPIYISLNGIDNLQKIKDTIFYNHMKNEHKFNIDLQFVDQIIDIGKKVPKFGDLFDIGSKVASSTRNILFDKINLENYFLIFDDLERISPKLEIQEILGYLFDNFIDRNIKCLIIGYENEIDCEDFDKIKEKIFRRMINFNPDSELLCRDFIDKKYIKSPIHDYLMKNINTLVWFIDEIKAKNLRTLDFFINTFEDIYKCADQLKDDLDILNSIFISTLILCIEYKDGKINYENLDDYKGLDFSSSYYFINKEKYDKQEEKPYSFLFIDKYVNQYKLEFKLLKSVFEYIITGYLDTIKLKNEIDEKYNIAKKPEWILALDKITDIRNIEIEDLEHDITNVIKYLKLGKYHLSRLIYIYSVLSYIKRRIFDDKWDYEDIDGLIKIALEKSSENPDNIPTIIEISTFTHVYDETIRGLEIYEYMKLKIIEKSNSQKK